MPAKTESSGTPSPKPCFTALQGTIVGYQTSSRQTCQLNMARLHLHVKFYTCSPNVHGQNFGKQPWQQLGHIDALACLPPRRSKIKACNAHCRVGKSSRNRLKDPSQKISPDQLKTSNRIPMKTIGHFQLNQLKVSTCVLGRQLKNFNGFSGSTC